MRARYVPALHRERDEALEHRNDGRERSEAHEHEEQRSPNLTEGHLLEYIWQGNEHERWPLIRSNSEREARRKDDEARHDRHERIETADAQLRP